MKYFFNRSAQSGVIQSGYRRKLLCLAPAALVFGMTVSPFAFAEQPAQASKDQSVESVPMQLAPITVSSTEEADPSLEYMGKDTRSATGLPISVKETPQSISVFTEKRMEDQRLNTINEVLGQTPGVSVKEYDSSRQYYYARGFEVTNLLIDGVPVMFDPGWGTGEQDMSTAIYEQVEIIKGPTGLMTGTGNPSAAINLVRKRAKATEFEGEAALTVGNRSQYNVTLDVANSLNTDKSVRGRMVLEQDHEDSFRDVGESARSMVYGILEADLSDKTLLTLGGSYQNVENDGATWGGLPLWYDDGSRTSWDRSKTTAADWAYWDVAHQNLFVELAHVINDDWEINARLNSGASDGDSQLLYVYGTPNETTGLGLFPWTGGKFTVDSEYKMADVFLNGRFDLLGRKHDATFGISQARREFVAHSYDVTSTSPIGDFNAWDGTGYPEFTYGTRFLYEKFTDIQTAAYGSARFNVSDKLNVITGARVTNYELDIAPGGLAIANGDKLEYNGEVTPYLGVLYDINDTWTSYASYTEIFATQGERDRNGDALDPVKGESYELGIKAGLMDNRLTLSAAAFRIVQDNLAQVDSGQTVPGTPDQAYIEAQGATSEGYELEMAGAITDSWDMQLGWTDYDAKDANGNEVNTEQPRKIFKLFTTYGLSGDLSQWTVGGGVSWEDRSYATATNAVTGLPEEVEQESFALLSFMTRYQLSNDFSLQLNIDNLTDETYYTNIGVFGQYAYGKPRSVTLTGKYSF